MLLFVVMNAHLLHAKMNDTPQWDNVLKVLDVLNIKVNCFVIKTEIGYQDIGYIHFFS